MTTVGGHPLRSSDFIRLPMVLPPPDATLTEIYRGLRHQMYESRELFRALFTKGHRSFGGYRFYSKPLKIPPDVAARVMSEMRNPARFQTWGGPYMCGGYHADYCFV